MNRNSLRKAAPAAALVLAFGLSACGAANESDSGASTGGADQVSGTLNAGGSSAQEAAIAAWKKNFQTANPDATVNYDPVGSGGGREQFLAGGYVLAGSDAYLSDEELATAKETCKSDVVEVPVYVSPIAVVYNLKDVKELNLAPKTIGAIFEGKITSWDDAAIKADNPDATLPSTKITPVHRSDDSGTTKNFTDYLDQASDGGWSGGVIETWPIKGGEAAEGTSGVIAAVKSGEGTIGYADESQAGDLGQAKVKVGDEFTAATPEAAAKILDSSKTLEGRAATDIAIDVDRKSTASGVYPIVLASYQIACQTYDDKATADLVKAWLTYIASSDGQSAAGDSAGSAPLTSDFGTKVQAAIETISAA
ncbi:phosphate ABC transporter substrate-binding protein PstS [Aeromicrobium sp. A1-2]|uniref:phosphate ABC transporter substrate-binding protein PstS n=1 Tax=Aeromicrobium sp. A1-2 TaxID=2107713 RepID=UPI000E4CA942|nr:phosphate ABC transporter substrate-binding protein PstS [Aeromicrobium sp. A1-2]AXT86082.1 phosphate ABC transporter substrate-binding protein PstS [Aeromicrobium sp. A1-2]